LEVVTDMRLIYETENGLNTEIMEEQSVSLGEWLIRRRV